MIGWLLGSLFDPPDPIDWERKAELDRQWAEAQAEFQKNLRARIDETLTKEGTLMRPRMSEEKGEI